MLAFERGALGNLSETVFAAPDKLYCGTEQAWSRRPNMALI